jgi:hypothetical protein
MSNPVPEDIAAQTRRVLSSLLPNPDKPQRPFAFEPGPSDVESIRDFHTLQLAYPEVWTRLTDKLTLSKAINFYAEHVKVKYGPSADGTETIPEEDRAEDVDEIRADLLGALAEDARPVAIDEKVRFYWPEIRPELWNWMGEENRNRFRDAANDLYTAQGEGRGLTTWDVTKRELMKDEVVELNEEMRNSSETAGRNRAFDRMTSLVHELQTRLAEKYHFDVFAPESYNYGLLATYRQKWKPGDYQTGDLVATMPLAPGESRKFSMKKVATKTRSATEAESSLQHLKTESQKTSRAETDISKRASLKGAFTNTSENGANVELADSSNTMVISSETSQESARAKKEFREAVIKAASEYRSERKYEVTTSTSDQIETTTSGEIQNPNNEITVTYLFYELQRQFEVAEQLHRVQPVILVAQEVPAPHEVDEEWLIAHEWILRRVLLDDKFKETLAYLGNGLLSDEQNVVLRRRQVDAERSLVGQLEGRLRGLSTKQDHSRRAVTDAIAQKDASQGLLEDVGETLFGGSDDGERARSKLEAAERALELVDADLTEAHAELLRASESLRRSTDELMEAIRQQLNRRIAVDQLRAHVKENILYYMQRIWDYEVPDQRYHRLYNLMVEVPLAPEDWSLELESSESSLRDAGSKGSGRPRLRARVGSPPRLDLKNRRLREVADLSRPLGYHGNYIIFPLKQSNFITTFMALNYLGDGLELWDPDELANHDIDVIVARLRRFSEEGKESFEKEWARIENGLRKLLTSRPPAKETIIVPWDHLFIEALKGHYTVLEDFKMDHRRIDVEKAKGETAQIHMETVRAGARILAGDNDDPKVDKTIRVQGTTVVPVVPTEER